MMKQFVIDDNGIDPNWVPKKKMHTRSKIPVVGLGTFGSDHISHKQMAETVKCAISVGYRHIDCASVYGNEDKIGRVLSEVIQAGIPREELWITSKVWNDMHDSVVHSCEKTLKDLQLDYLDLYLVHWPFPNYHAPGCDVSSRNPDSKPYIHEDFMKTWAQMESLVEKGLVKNIGTSNMTIPKLKLVMRDCKIKPTCNEMEMHPHFQQTELFQFCMDNDIQPIGYCPIGSPARPERDRTPEDTCDIEDPIVVEIAQRIGVHPAVVCLMWAYKNGQVAIPLSTNPKNYYSNLKAAVENPLTDEDMTRLKQIDKDCRLIKGQVFSWKEDQSWEDLWDLDGEITPA